MNDRRNLDWLYKTGQISILYGPIVIRLICDVMKFGLFIERCRFFASSTDYCLDNDTLLEHYHLVQPASSDWKIKMRLWIICRKMMAYFSHTVCVWWPIRNEEKLFSLTKHTLQLFAKKVFVHLTSTLRMRKIWQENVMVSFHLFHLHVSEVFGFNIDASVRGICTHFLCRYLKV